MGLYRFISDPNDPDLFTFITSQGLQYLVRFCSLYEYFREKDPKIESEIFEISFWVAENKKSKYDSSVSFTILQIIYEYTGGNTPLFYRCQYDDDKHYARGLLFNKWFDLIPIWQNQTGNNIEQFQHEKGIAEYHSEDFSATLLFGIVIPKSNPDFNSIIEVFRNADTDKLIEEKFGL